MSADIASNTERAVPDCPQCDGFGTLAVRNGQGIETGQTFCQCAAGCRRREIEAARRAPAAVVEDLNRRLWPLSLDILANPTSLTTAARPLGHDGRALTAVWPE